MASPPPTPTVLPNKGGVITTLTLNDVLSGRGKLVNSHPGNIRFLTRIVPEYFEEYCHPTTTRTERAHVVARLVNEVRSRSNPPGRFLMGDKENPGQYFEIGDEKAWKKAAKALQEASKHNMSGGFTDIINRVPTQGKLESESSNKNKKSRSKETSSSHRQQPASDRRLVIIRPSSNSGNDDDVASSHHEHQYEQWPLYHRLCRSYGFSVEVEQFLEPYKVNEKGGKTPCHDEVGPQMKNLLLIDNNSCFVMGNFSARYGVVERDGEFVRLRHIGERLCVRSSSMCVNKPRKSKSLTGFKRKTNSNAYNAGPHHPPNLNDGDIIQTLDGKPNPSFAMLYGMMCRKEKLVLEVISGEASSKSPREKQKGDGQNDGSSTVNAAVRKARKQPVTENESVAADCTMNDVTNANNANPVKTYCAGSKKWNAAAAQKARELLLSENNEIENFVGMAGATSNASVDLTAPEKATCARGNRNSNNDGSSTVTPAARKARKQPITEGGRVIVGRARTHVSNANNPGKIDCAGSKKWNAAAARQAREQLHSETEVDIFLRGTGTTTDALHVDITAQGKTNYAGGDRIRKNDASSTVPVVVRKDRKQSDADGEQVIAETGATIDTPNADYVVSGNTFAGDKRQEDVFTGACSLSVADLRMGITSARDADDTTRERTVFSWADSERHSNCDKNSSKTSTIRPTEMKDVREFLGGIGAIGDAIIAEKSSPGSRSSDSDLSELEILPKEHGMFVSNVPIKSTTLSRKKLVSRWGPPLCGNDSYEVKRIILSSTTSNRVPVGNDSAPTISFQFHPDNPKLNTSNCRRGDRDITGLDRPRMGSIALETPCKQVVASYDGGRMEDELFNMVEEELSRDQQLRNLVCNDDRMTSSSLLRKVHGGNTPVFSPPPVDTAATKSTTGVNNQPLKTDKVVSVSSPSPPALFDCAGDDGNSVSSSSCPSSSCAKSMFMSSSSSSDSSGSSKINNNNHPQPTIPTCKLGALSEPLNSDTHTSYTSATPARKRPPPSIGSSATISARSSTSLLQNDEAPTSLARLWPDPSDIIKAMTLWSPPVAQVRNNFHDGKQIVEFYGPIRRSDSYFYGSGNEQSRYNPLLQSSYLSRNGEIPREFKNTDEVMDVLASTLLNEGLYSINGDYHAEKYSNGRWNRSSYQLRMTKLTEVSPIFQSKSYFDDDKIKLYEAQFSAHGETNLPPSNLSELYCMHFRGWEHSKFGIVAHDFPTTISFRTYPEGKSLLKLWLVVHQNERDMKETGWLSRTDFKELLDPYQNNLTVRQDAIFTLISCGSTTNVVRQFEAIKCMSYLKPHLQRALFSSYNTSIPTSTTTAKPRSLPIDVWHHLKSSHNSYQLSAISKLLAGSCRENVCLVQGPPGTGKSSTIVGLVTALLSGKAPLPLQRQSGCIIHPGKTMGTAFAEPQARNRILVCAATNQAVDSLAWKIKQGSIGPSGILGDFTMARYGSLPENSRNLSDQKPEILSSMEAFLYEINVDRRACDGMQDFEYYEEEREPIMSWSPEKMKPQRKKRRKVVGRAKVRSQVLGSCSVVVTTLSGAGSKAFIDAVCRDPTRNDSEFDAVIIDEACQASEPESLIPFKYNPTTITLVGDPQQLPVLTLSGFSTDNKLYERSLFERLKSLNFPTILLRNQYRMHEACIHHKGMRGRQSQEQRPLLK